MARKHHGSQSASAPEPQDGAGDRPAEGTGGRSDPETTPSDELHVQPDRFVPGAFVVAGGGVEHSFVDPNDPTHLEFPYMQRISEAIDVWVPAGERPRVIHVGGAGMSLARYVAFTRPTSPQIVLEPDERLTDEVRRELPLPVRSGIKVRPQDGRTGLAAMPADYADMVIVDAFAHLSVPGELVTSQAFADYDRVLRDGGLLAMNVTDAAPFTWTHRVLAGAAQYFGELSACAEPAVFKGRRMGNVVILCSHLELPMSALMSRGRGDAFPYRWLFGEELDRWRGAPEAFDDLAPQGSPVSRDARTHFE